MLALLLILKQSWKENRICVAVLITQFLNVKMPFEFGARRGNIPPGVAPKSYQFLCRPIYSSRAPALAMSPWLMFISFRF